MNLVFAELIIFRDRDKKHILVPAVCQSTISNLILSVTLWESRNAYRILDGKPEGEMSLWRP